MAEKPCQEQTNCDVDGYLKKYGQFCLPCNVTTEIILKSILCFAGK
jgi:hypothetical protein